jgi:CxxC motif-containing protein
MNKEFICIVCPRGCHISVDEQNVITGNQCKRGETYVINEMTNPKRVLTTTVKTVFPEMPRASVKTSEAIPKGMLYQAMEVINQVVIDKEMNIGEVVVQNILNTGVDVVLTKAVKM